MFSATFVYKPFDFATNIHRSYRMIAYPCSKINLGLNVISKRQDGYHDIETVFYPVPLCDTLEIEIDDNPATIPQKCHLFVDGNDIECSEDDNLVVKAYRLLAKDYRLPSIKARLHKAIPSQAGLGGGSSDAAYMLLLINKVCGLSLDEAALIRHAASLGADCPFFINPRMSFATGIGDIISPLKLEETLKGCYLVIVKPDVSMSTKEAYSMIKPRRPDICCEDVLTMPMAEWKMYLTNDFEPPVFSKHPLLGEIKQQLYDAGAIYAQMSGSGTSLFGLYKEKPDGISRLFQKHFNATIKL